MFAYRGWTGVLTARLSELTPIFGKFKVATSSGIIAQRCWSCSDTHRRNTAFTHGRRSLPSYEGNCAKLCSYAFRLLKKKMNLNLFKHFLLAILKTFDLGKKKKKRYN